MKYRSLLILILCSSGVLSYTPGLSQQNCFPLRDPALLQLKTDFDTTFMLYRAVDAIKSSVVPQIRSSDFKTREGSDNPVVVCNETLLSEGICGLNQLGEFILDGDFAIINKLIKPGPEPLYIPIKEKGVYCLYASSTRVHPDNTGLKSPGEFASFESWYDFGHAEMRISLDGHDYERYTIWKCLSIFSFLIYASFMEHCESGIWHYVYEEKTYEQLKPSFDFFAFKLALLGCTYLMPSQICQDDPLSRDHRMCGGVGMKMGWDCFYCCTMWLMVSLVPVRLKKMEKAGYMIPTSINKKEVGKDTDYSREQDNLLLAYIVMLLISSALMCYKLITDEKVYLFTNSSMSYIVYAPYIVYYTMMGALYVHAVSGILKVAKELECSKFSQKVLHSTKVSVYIHIGLHLSSWVGCLMVQLLTNWSIYWTWDILSNPVMEEAGMKWGLIYVLLKNLSKFCFLATHVALQSIWEANKKKEYSTKWK